MAGNMRARATQARAEPNQSFHLQRRFTMNSVHQENSANARTHAGNLERIFQQAAAAALVATLGACGGGGGGDAPSPAPPPFVTPAALPAVMSVPTPNGYDANKLAAFDRLNTLRLQAGLGMVASAKKLDDAAQAHVDWMIANNTYSHSETAGTVGYTGDNFAFREVAAGYQGLDGSEIMAAGVAPETAVDELVNTVYHRERALAVAPVDVGIGFSTSFSAPAVPEPLVMEFSTPAADPIRGGGQVTQSTISGVVIWPVDGADRVPVSMGNEIPDPVPGQDVTSLGMAVSLGASAGQKISVSSFSLTDTSNGKVEATRLLTQANDPNFEVGPEYAAIVPYAYLQSATRYRVDFVGQLVDSTGTRNLSKTWYFTTAP